MDDLSKLIQGAGAPDAAAIGGLAQAVQGEGGLDALVGKLRDAGLGGAVDSWVSTGPNEAVDPDQLGQALGPDTVSRLSASSGLSVQSLLPMLAAFLPQIVNMLTPDGKTPPGGLNGAAAGGLPDLGGMIGSVLGGAGGSSGSAGTGIEDVLGGLGGLLGGKGS